MNRKTYSESTNNDSSTSEFSNFSKFSQSTSTPSSSIFINSPSKKTKIKFQKILFLLYISIIFFLFLSIFLFFLIIFFHYFHKPSPSQLFQPYQTKIPNGYKYNYYEVIKEKVEKNEKNENEELVISDVIRGTLYIEKKTYVEHTIKKMKMSDIYIDKNQDMIMLDDIGNGMDVYDCHGSCICENEGNERRLVMVAYPIIQTIAALSIAAALSIFVVNSKEICNEYYQMDGMDDVDKEEWICSVHEMFDCDDDDDDEVWEHWRCDGECKYQSMLDDTIGYYRKTTVVAARTEEEALQTSTTKFLFVSIQYYFSLIMEKECNSYLRYMLNKNDDNPTFMKGSRVLKCVLGTYEGEHDFTTYDPAHYE